MDATTDDLLFRMGFEDHPQAGSKLEALAKAVEATQERISRVFDGIGDRILTSADRARAAAGEIAGLPGGINAAALSMRESVQAAAADFRASADRSVKVHADMVERLESLRQKNLQSADAESLRLEELAKRQAELARQAAEPAQAVSDRLGATAVAGDTRKPADAVETSLGRMEALARQQLDLLRDASEQRVKLEQETVARVKAIRRQDVESAEATTSRLLELSKSVESLGKNRTATTAPTSPGVPASQPAPAVSTPAAAARPAPVISSPAAISPDAIKTAQDRADEAIRQSQRWQSELDKYRQADMSSAKQHSEEQRVINEALVVAERQAAEKRADIHKQLAIDLETIKRAEGITNPKTLQEGVALLDAEEASKRVAAAAKALKAERDQDKREADRLAKEAERLRGQATRDAQARQRADEEETAFRQRIWMREVKRKQEAEAAIRQAAHESTASRIDAYQKEQTAHDRALREMAQGRAGLIEGLGQTATAIGKLSRGMVMFGLAQGDELEKVVRRLAAVQTGIDTIAGAGELMRGVSKTWEALRLITLGNVRAKQAETAASKAAVAGSAQVQAALAAETLSASRAAAAHQMLAAARSSGGSVSIAPPAVGRQIAPGSVAAGPVARGAVASQAARGAVAGQAARGGIRSAVAGGAARVATHATTYTGIGGSLATLAGAATAAAAGLAFAGKSAVEMGKEARTAGIGGGARAGSWTDRVGGSDWNPASWLVAADVKWQAAADAEKTRRMENASQLYKMELEHLRKLSSIQLEAALEMREVNRATKEAQFDRRLEFARTPEERIAINDQQRVAAKGDIHNAQAGFRRSREGSEDQQAYAEQLIEAENRLIGIQEQRARLERDIAAEKRRTTLEEIKGIEDVINARMKERAELEASHRTAKERFGALSEMDQQRTIAALERARKNPQAISQVDAELIERNIDTDESRDIISQRNIERADRAGYDERVGQETAERRKIIDRDVAENIGRLSEKSGQSEKELRERAEAGQLKGAAANVELVDRRAFEINAATLEDAFAKRILDEISDLEKARDEKLKAAIQEGMRQREADERQNHSRRASEATAGGGL